MKTIKFLLSLAFLASVLTLATGCASDESGTEAEKPAATSSDDGGAAPAASDKK